MSGQSCSQPQCFGDQTPRFDGQRRRKKSMVFSKKGGFFRPDKRQKKRKFL